MHKFLSHQYKEKKTPQTPTTYPRQNGSGRAPAFASILSPRYRMFRAALTSRSHTALQWGQALSRQLPKGEGPPIRVMHLEHIWEVRNSSIGMTVTPGNRESSLRIRARGVATGREVEPGGAKKYHSLLAGLAELVANIM